MKIFAGNRDDDSVIECTEADLMCTLTELNTLIDALIQFQKEINVYIQKNESKSKLGITHMHYQDFATTWSETDSDFVVYVNLDE